MTDIARTTAILDVMADSRRCLTLSDLATRTGYPRSSVHRIVQALEREHFVVRVADRPGYTLGPGLLKFGLNAHLRLLGANRTQLVTVSRAVHENTELAVFSGGNAVVIDQVVTAEQSKSVAATGRNFSLHATAIGKALLSELPVEQARNLLPAPLAQFTANTVTTPAVVLDELDAIRMTGIAFDREEHHAGMCAIATATHANIGGLQAVAVIIPAHRMQQKVGLAIEALHRVNPRINITAARRYFLAGRASLVN